ncbi:MAG: hypothetical protein LBC87_03385 [Fibromonadaceae bacterium]|jgi:hypothetical protein|nr:hypothetical protein [Fibromonadaceae bacterium]
MSNKLSKFALAVGFVLALAFTLSCSSDSDEGGGNPEPTYFYSMYGIKNSSSLEYEILFSYIPKNPSFEDVKTLWSRIKQLDNDFLESGRVPSSEGRNVLAQHDLSPTDIDDVIKKLNTRGNDILEFYPTDPQAYYMIIWYIERE